jgi:hypothetical protein
MRTMQVLRDGGTRQDAHPGGIIRIFGAGYWRKGKRIYEQENHLHGRSDQEA